AGPTGGCGGTTPAATTVSSALTAQSLSTLGARVRGLAAGAPAEALVLAAAGPPLFLHPTYPPHVSVAVAWTTVDVSLADAAVAAVLAAAVVRSRRDGWQPLRHARLV